MKKKIIVAHPAQQHSIKTAIGLQSKNILYKYITTVYQKKGTFTYFITKILSGENKYRANTRQNRQLNNSNVKLFNEVSSLFLLLLQRIDKKKDIYHKLEQYINQRFGKKVAKFAIRHNVDAVIIYDTVSLSTLEYLNDNAPDVVKIVDMSAPNFVYMNEIFENDTKDFSELKLKLINEINSDNYQRKLLNAKKEIRIADYFIAASNFTKKSLLNYGIAEERIFLIPYGIENNNNFNELEIKNLIKISEKIEVIFVGRITQQKGILYFLEAMDNLNSTKFNVSLAGTIASDNKIYQKYKNKFNFLGHLTKDKMEELYKKADVLVFPSLADGFGLSVIEALSFGVATLVSENAGASDIIIDGYNGYVIPTCDSKVIINTLNYLEKNRETLEKIKANSINSVKEYTWDKYNKKLTDMFKEIL